MSTATTRSKAQLHGAVIELHRLRIVDRTIETFHKGSRIASHPRSNVRRRHLACEDAGITVTLPKPVTPGAKSDGRFGKQDFVYLPTETPIDARPANG